MMSAKHSKRIISLLLCAALVLSYIPFSFSAKAASVGTSIADAKTLNNWTQWFSDSSSRYAGSVYLDKSVYTASEAKSDNYFADIRNNLTFGVDNFGNENFMIALSAVGSNSEVLGYSHVPTDTMLVLDASTSMGTGSASTTAIDDMVAGANSAVKRLLSLNNYNRVGVVIYNGTASVLLPLDRYTSTNSDGDILTYVRRNNQNRISIASNVKNCSGELVDTSYIAQAQGTYTQGGIYTAAQQFLSADTVIEDGKIQGGTKRIPIMVLMSDGEPSYRTITGSNTTINKYNAATNSNVDKSNFREDEVTAFSTMLTAAWAEGEISAHYENDTRFYTLGYALSSNHQYAQNVLDPMNPNNSLASRFSAFASQYLKMDQNTTASIKNENNQTAFRVTRISSPSKVKSLDYVDRYWQASGTSHLTAAFDEIVDEIVIQSRYYSTLVSGNDYQQDGFISFTDEIGPYMEVKNIKGLYIGEGKLVSGGMFSEFAVKGEVTGLISGNYSQDQLRGFENEILAAVAKRLNISLSEASLLITTAKEKGFISYTSPTVFSNYIAWYADADNKYIAPYTQGSERNYTDAKYIVRSYLYMGDVTQNHVETSMLYASVRVREDIKTGKQIVDMEIPAALLPLITYTITVDGDVLKDDNITGITCKQKKPISLLFEVGLDSEITPINISEKVAEDFHKDSNGVYSFYTNRWRNDDGDAFVRPTNPDPHIFNHGIMNTTVAQFIPSLENERYYYTENIQILDSNYNVYTGAKPSQNNVYYVAYNWIEGNAQSAHLKTAYDQVANEILMNPDNIIQIEGKQGWFIKKGTPQYYFGESVHGEHGHDHKEDAENETNTLLFSSYPEVAHHTSEGHNGYHILSYLGNNGKITVEPAQGIKLTKTVSESVNNAPKSFDFEIGLSGASLASSYPVYIERANGSTESLNTAVVNGKLTVTISDGDVAYITGLPTGVQYSISELYNSFYTAHSTNSSGIIAKHTINEVKFVNAPKGFGSLLIEKDVTHPFTAVSDDFANKEFEFVAVFTGDLKDLELIRVSDNSMIPEVGINTHIYSFKLKDGHDVLFSHIAENITYTVTEVNIPAGFTPNKHSFAGEIAKDTQSEALFVNNYAPEGVVPNVQIHGEKTLTGRPWESGVDAYQVVLQQVSFGGQQVVAVGQPVKTDIVKSDGWDYVIDMSALPAYENVGSYNYIVYEAMPEDPAERVENVYYDASFALFSVIIADNGSGKLYIDDVVVHQNTAQLTEGSEWTIEKSFTNTFNVAPLHIPVHKVVVDEFTGAEVSGHSGGIVFGLYDSVSSNTPVYTTITNEQGKAEFVFNVKQKDYTAARYFYLRELLPLANDQVVGMTYNTDVQYVVEIAWLDESEPAPAVKYYVYDAARENGLGAEIVNIETNPFVITNKYDDGIVSNTAISLGGKKTLNGGALRQDDTFRIALYETDSSFNISGVTPVEKIVNGLTPNGEYVFDNITFNTEGIKYFVVSEIVENIPGISYDKTQYHITVTVEKAITAAQKTILTARISHIHKVGVGDVAANELNFNNIYSINANESVVISGNKILNGRTLVEGEFTFGINTIGSTSPLYTVSNDKNGNFTFPTIRYNIHNATSCDETYTYVIKEIVPADADKKGITYNSNGKTEYTLVVKLTDNGMGGVTKTVTLDGVPVTTIALTFVNTYSASDTSLTLSGTKYLENKSSGDFTFRLYETEDETFTMNGSLVPKTANVSVKDGSGVYFFNLHYTSADKGYHYYVLEEAVPAVTNGILYDSTEYHITVNVLDNGHGEMEAHVMSIVSDHISGNITATTLDFTNKYKATSTEYVIKGEKILNNKTLEADLFEFRLSNDEGEITTVKNTVNGSFEFPAQYFDAPGEYKFFVEEINGGSTIRGIVYDNAKFVITIPVVDNGNGQLFVDEANILIEKDVNGQKSNVSTVLFVNSYNAEASDELYLEGVKQIENATLKGEDFAFELYESNASFDKIQFVQSVKNLENGTFKFDKALSFEQAQKYYYLVVEKKGNLDYIVYDETVYGVVITVSDNNEGKLVVEKKEIFVISDEGTITAEKIEFVNKYDPADKKVIITGEKLLENRTLADREFKFFLYQTDSSYRIADNAIPMEAWNKADGTIAFDEITLDQVGNYYFVIVEDSNTTANRVTNDTSVYRIALEIRDNQEGSLYEAGRVITKVGAEGTVEKITFKNVFSPVPENPKTGDEANLVLWIALMCISGGAVLCMQLYRKNAEEETSK